MLNGWDVLGIITLGIFFTICFVFWIIATK